MPPSSTPRAPSPVADQFLRITSGVFVDLLTPDDLLQAAMEKVIELTGATKGFLILTGADGELDFKIARNMRREEIEQPRNRISRNIIRGVVETGKSVLSGNAIEDPRFENMESVHGLVLKSIICAPLKNDSQVLGVIYLENHLTEGVFTSEHYEMVDRVAEEASLALGMTRTLESLRGERDRLAEENRGLREVFRAEYEFGRFIGGSSAMNQVASQMSRIAERRNTVLITGESGTGKELVARILHATGPWKDKPFVAVNCAAVPGSLFESEIFGHVKGAFTGADRNRAGKVEAAEGGTLFLDEVGDMALEMQAKLLRLLQERTYERVGDNTTRRADIRVVAATNKDLKRAIAAGEFREDLYYRLNELPLKLPPLRERQEDVEELAEHFLRQEARNIPGFTPKALACLRAHSWPGNVRELRNVVTRAATYTNDDALIDDKTVSMMLDERVSQPAANGGDSVALDEFAGLSYKEVMAELEKTYLTAMMDRFESLSRTELAEKLGLPRRTLFQRMKALGITGS